MAISAEAYEYLREVEKIPKWTELPDNDERIMKLRVLFDTPQIIENKEVKHKIRTQPVKATKDGTSVVFNSIKECAEFLGIMPDSVSKALKRQRSRRGYSFERVEE